MLLKALGAVRVEIDLSLLHVQARIAAHIVTLAGNAQTLLTQSGGIFQILKVQCLTNQVVILGGKACNVILYAYACLYGALVVEFLHTVTGGLYAESLKYGPIGTDLCVQGLVQHVTVGYGGAIGLKCGVIAGN